MVLAWYEDEDETKRRSVTILIGYLLYRTYRITEAQADTLIPARGTVLPGDLDGILAARVREAKLGRPLKEGKVELNVEFIKPVAYS